MINFNDIVKKNIKEHNPNWRPILDRSYRIFIIEGSGDGKTNSLLVIDEFAIIHKFINSLYNYNK